MRLLCLAAAFPLLAGAQEEPRKAAPPQIDVRLDPAFGRPLASPWQPFVLRLDNPTRREIDARIRVADEVGLSAVTRREPLAPGARKRLFFYLPANPRWGWSGATAAVTFKVTEPGGLRKEGTAAQIQTGFDPDALRVGFLTAEPRVPAGLRFPARVAGQAVDAVVATPETLPDRRIGLDALDLLVVHDAPLQELLPDQLQALSDYARGGGTIVLAPGSDPAWFNQAAVQRLAPIAVAGTTTEDRLDSLQARFAGFGSSAPFLVHRITNGAAAKQPAVGRALLEYAAGFGRVLVLPFDLRRAPFPAWDGTEPLWAEILGSAPKSPRVTSPALAPGVMEHDVFEAMTAQVNPYPPFLLLFGIAAVFLACVGPVNWLLLRRLGMPLLFVLTVPLVSALFLGVVVASGYVLKGTSTVAYSLRFLSTRTGLDVASERQCFLLFSASARSYDAVCERGTAVLPQERAVVRGRRNAAEDADFPLEIEDGPASTIRGIQVGQWQSWRAVSQSLRPLGQGVTFTASAGVVRIANGSPHPIRRGVYVEAMNGGFATPFGPVAPGATVEAVLDESRARPAADLGFPPESYVARSIGPWLDSLLDPRRPREDRKRERFLLCVLEEGDPPVRVDAASPGRSRSATLLHVEEAPE
jgi:hypothetical protein